MTTVALAPNDSMLLQRGHTEFTSQGRSSAMAVWEKEQEKERLIAQQSSQCLLSLGTELAACHSGLTDPRGDLTLSHVAKAQSKQFHNSVGTAKIKMPM